MPKPSDVLGEGVGGAWPTDGNSKSVARIPKFEGFKKWVKRPSWRRILNSTFEAIEMTPANTKGMSRSLG